MTLLTLKSTPLTSRSSTTAGFPCLHATTKICCRSRTFVFVSAPATMRALKIALFLDLSARCNADSPLFVTEVDTVFIFVAEVDICATDDQIANEVFVASNYSGTQGSTIDSLEHVNIGTGVQKAFNDLEITNTRGSLQCSSIVTTRDK